MLLVDTNIIIDYWKNPSTEMDAVFKWQKCCICGVVVAELVRGAVSAKDVDRIKQALSGFKWLHLEESDWESVGELLYRLRIKGISVPFTDAIISFLSIKYSTPVWTRDRHFQMIQEAYPGLEIFAFPNTDI